MYFTWTIDDMLKIAIANVYMPESSGLGEINNDTIETFGDLQQSINIFKQMGYKILLIGDFNSKCKIFIHDYLISNVVIKPELIFGTFKLYFLIFTAMVFTVALPKA